MSNRKKTIQYAFQKSIPIMTGYIVLGMGFGILLQKHDIFRMCGRRYDQPGTCSRHCGSCSTCYNGDPVLSVCGI